MERKKVYELIEEELNYISKKEKETTSHIVEDFTLASAMEAIRFNLYKANSSWYKGKQPYEESMEYFRKIASICIKMGEKYGLPKRK